MSDAATQTDAMTPAPVLQIINPQTVTLGMSYDDLDIIIGSSSKNPSKKRRKSEPESVEYMGDEYDYFNKLPKTKKKQILQEEKRLLNISQTKTPLRFKILTSNINDVLKAYALKKLDILSVMDPSSGEYNKLSTFLEAVSKVPVGIYKSLAYKEAPSIGQFLENTKHKLDQSVYGHNECKDQIIRLLAQWISNPKSQGLVIGIEGPMGCGKCHAKDTPILMHDGRIKLVQDVCIGDVLMGDDGTPRNVLTLGRGMDQLYDIIYKNQWGEKYTVNSEHILCLYNIETLEIDDICLKDYISLPARQKDKYIGIRACYPINFKDSRDQSPLDDAVLQECLLHASIPHDILCGSIHNRQRLLTIILSGLSGLSAMSTKTGYITHSCKRFLQDITFLARSLGVTCYAINDQEIHITTISKNTMINLLKLKVIPVHHDEYYGFTIDGNSRYMLGDFTVTHNTTLVKHGICKALGLPFGFIPLGGVSDGSYLIGHSYTYEGSRWGRIIDILTSCECMNPILFFDELDKVSNTKYGEEIINILIHLTDATQNSDFHDKYFADLPLDLSRCLVVFSYNNGELINPILRDRMVCIKTNGYTDKDKKQIVKEYMLHEIYAKFNFTSKDIVLDDEMLDIIISKTDEEKGVRNLKRSLEDIISRINLKRLTKKQTVLPYKITNSDIKDVFKAKDRHENPSLQMMYL